MVETLEIALIQTPLHWEQPQANRTMLSDLIAALAHPVDMIVLPEMFTTGFTMHPDEVAPEEGVATLEWMRRIARESEAVLVGSVIYQENGSFFNRLLAVQPDGNHHQYDKRHTFTLAGEHKVYQAGSEKLIFQYKGFRFCPMICYDLRFPVWSRNAEDYDVLVYVANWPAPRINAWDTLLKARAIENMAYCIGVNRVGVDAAGYQYPGHSAAYDVLGEQLVFSNEETILYTTLSREHIVQQREKLKFLQDRDSFSLK